jgi:hypothetical protein
LNELLKSFTKSFNQMVNNLPIEDWLIQSFYNLIFNIL